MTPPRPRILVVDDSATARAALERVLRGRFEIFTAGDGSAGLALAHQVHPHLVLLDVMMPVMGGLEACRALRVSPVTRHTPVILVTSQDDEWDVEAGYTSGCTDYVIKPVDSAELLAKVDSWLGAALDDVPA